MTEKLNLIKEVLERQEKSQSWLAGQLDVEVRTVNRIVNNHRQPSLKLLFKIAKILRVSPRDLING
jgi:DNA-binding XRE family transcriptional regulator